MSKSGYPYAPDEFDQPPSDGAPMGVHRTQVSGWRKTWPFLVVIVLFGGLAAGGFYFWLNQGGGSSDSPTTAAAPLATEDVDGGDESGEDPTMDPPDTDLPPESEVPAVEDPAVPEVPAADVNTAASIRVLNGAGIAGLAAKGAETLEAAGFTTVEATDYKGDALSANTVYYKTPDMESTAMHIAAQFGIAAENVQLVPTNQAQVSVILMSDY